MGQSIRVLVDRIDPVEKKISLPWWKRRDPKRGAVEGSPLNPAAAGSLRNRLRRRRNEAGAPRSGDHGQKRRGKRQKSGRKRRR